MALKSPLRWYGAKGELSKKILPYFPDHHTYVEVFGGGGSMLLAKKPAQVEIYNDLNADVVDFFRIFHDPDKLQQLIYKCKHHPYSRDIYTEYVKRFPNITVPVDKAYHFYSIVRMSFNGLMGATGVSLNKDRNYAKQYQDHVDRFEAVALRLNKVQLDNRDWTEVLDRYDGDKTFFYLDPPYMPHTRKDPDIYDYEMSAYDHERLIYRLRSIKSRVLLSGYGNLLYDSLGWNRADFPISCNAARHGSVDTSRVESLWYNYDLEGQLKLL